MPRPKNQQEQNPRHATQEEKNELFACLLKTITRLTLRWIDAADIEVKEEYTARSHILVSKTLRLSWREPYQYLGCHTFPLPLNNAVVDDDVALSAFTKMLQIHEEKEIAEWEVTEEDENE